MLSAFTSLSPFELAWLTFGFFGQFIFFMRFIVQWWASEKEKKIVVPMSFWYLSIAGTVVILIYSIHIKDIVFTTAQILSLFIYARNIMLGL
ncbi:MAG TPA: lipid-A-disaccharide synthase N-terminal domain-containing protein [Candidatus Paceibacterota bacterium]|nr:lipid-A-disaccharide synthase N-terminal domain-containing protein [Candidatus Paceibacterota bacterium]